MPLAKQTAWTFDWAKPWYDGKTVLVTGGSSGIGAAISAAFRDAGANVSATGFSMEEVERARSDQELAGISYHALDVRDNDTVTALVGSFKHLDVVVNCAGKVNRGREMEIETFMETVDINLHGTMRTCIAARPLLAASSGAIVNIASMLSFFGGALVPGYASSKGGVAQLTKSLAIAFGDDGIRVNAIAPGWIATPLSKDLREDPSRSAAITGRTVLKRWGDPREVASGALYLCSPAASFVTGTIFTIDGGYSVV